KVIFSDESPFRLFGTSGKQLIRRRRDNSSIMRQSETSLCPGFLLMFNTSEGRNSEAATDWAQSSCDVTNSHKPRNMHSVGTSYAQAALSAQSRSPLVPLKFASTYSVSILMHLVICPDPTLQIMRCGHDTPEHDYGIVLLGTSLVRITIPQLIYVTHLDP
ncbi:unnamed protein product, partial [Ranitomeya imitator]